METRHRVERIILIDDDRFEHIYIRRLANRSEIIGDVVSFQSADEAIDCLGSDDAPDVAAILLDINMPQTDGFEFLGRAARELDERFAKIPVFIVTSSENPADLDRSKQFREIKAYFRKPVSAEDLSQIADLVGQ